VITYQEFRIALYEEHIEEASFLYEQCRSLAHDSEVSWRRISQFEERLEAHIDALVVGMDVALEVCRARSQEGDFGELFAAICVFCRQRRADFLSEALQSLEYTDIKKSKAVADALKYELPLDWSNYIGRALARGDARLTPLLATVCGYLRLPVGAVLQQALVSDINFATPIIYALGRLRYTPAQTALTNRLQDSDASVKAVALLALCRLGIQASLERSYLVAQKENWPRITLGLGGDRTTNNMLMEIAQTSDANSDCLLALGLLGNPASLQTLYDSLKRPSLADSAALALNWITGAQLFEDIFVLDEVKEDELFENEIQAWRERKEAPKRADGKPFGQTIRKLSPNKDIWKRWFANNAARFDMNFRYRSGELYSPVSLLENLADENSDHQLRKFAAEELVIRYGCDVPFEVDMPVAQQLRAIEKIRTWIDTDGSRFKPGLWYFAAYSQS
jgi:uncharacterized protein (TIGR02270 family)